MSNVAVSFGWLVQCYVCAVIIGDDESRDVKLGASVGCTKSKALSCLNINAT